VGVPWKHVCLAACLLQLSIPLFSWPTESGGTHVSTGAPLYGEAGSGVRGHMAVLELTSEVGRASELRDAWQRQIPPR
jgi:hypothetical protein